MNQRLLNALHNMWQRDADTRARLLSEGRLYGDYASEMRQVHRQNAIQLNEIVAEHGWPGIAAVGDEGCRTAWMLAQHSICTPDLQRKFLKLLQQAVVAGDAPPRHAALLVDRVHFNEGKPQVYGTAPCWIGTPTVSLRAR